MARFFSSFAGRYLALFLSLAALWFMLSGYYTKTVLLVFGLASILLTVWLTARAGFLDRDGVPTKIFPDILPYMFWLTVEIGKANLAVLGHAFSPVLRLSPKLVRVPVNQRSDVGRVIFANSITLTPGTVSIDLGEDEVLVHALTESLADVEGMTDMGRRVCRLERAPGENG